MQLATSTLAMTAYNLTAQAGRPVTAQELRSWIDGPPTESEIDVVLVMLRTLGRVSYAGGVVDVLDKKRRIVRLRDRSDAETLADGTIIGGWNGWMVQCKQRGALAIEDAIAEGNQ